MIQRISAANARNNFSDLLGKVYYGGKRFVISKLGKPYAVLINIDEYKKFDSARRYFFEKVDAVRKKNKGNPPLQVKKDVSAAVLEVRKKRNLGDND